jgi:hypothetical protein
MRAIVFTFGFLLSSIVWDAGTAPRFAQDVRPIGIVQVIDPPARQIKIKTDAGPELTIAYDSEARFVQVAPGAKDLSNAITIKVADVAVGDRILARGRIGNDSNSFIATSIVVMSRADLAKKHAAERAEWERRGIGGLITAVNPGSQEITIKAPAIVSTQPLVISFKQGALLRRYAPDSVKFSDALPSRFEELAIGDQVRALGTITEDRSRFTAEELVSGSFRTIAATVVGLDVGTNTIVVTDLASTKRVQVNIVRDTTMRRLSPQVTQMLASRNQSAGSDASQGNARDLQSILEKLPAFSVADLKPGDALIISCTNSSDGSRVTAITILAGVEPILRSSSKGGRPDLGSWNLDLNMSVGLP